MASSLSSVVSDLVRAQMGGSVNSSVTNDDLDRHVADLLVREAKKRAEKYSQLGIRAYLASSIADSNAPKPNKRFLTSIIRSTDDHNKTILRAQAESAREIKRERDEAERRDRRARAEEAVAAERDRNRSSGRRVKNSESWDHWDGRNGDRKRKKRDWESWNGDSDDDRDRRHRRRHRSRSSSKSRDRDKGKESSRHSKSHSKRSSGRHRSRSRDRDRHSKSSHRRSRRSPSPSASSRTLDDDDSYSKRRRRSRSRSPRRSKSPSDHKSAAQPPPPKKARPRSPSPPESPDLKASRSKRPPSPSDSSMDMSRSPTPGPSQAPQLPSKMDKYFEESYDPMLDVAPLTVPKVPATGLINNAEFEGWDAMLELLKQRNQDKEDKKRLEKLGFSKDEIRKSLATGSVTTSKLASDRWNGSENSVLDIAYSKRGSVREWDLGKETPT